MLWWWKFLPCQVPTLSKAVWDERVLFLQDNLGAASQRQETKNSPQGSGGGTACSAVGEIGGC